MQTLLQFVFSHFGFVWWWLNEKERKTKEGGGRTRETTYIWSGSEIKIRHTIICRRIQIDWPLRMGDLCVGNARENRHSKISHIKITIIIMNANGIVCDLHSEWWSVPPSLRCSFSEEHFFGSDFCLLWSRKQKVMIRAQTLARSH